MLKKIIAGAQTVVEQAALKLALKLELPYGGWQDGNKAAPLAGAYRLQSLPVADSQQAYRQNILSADGVLILVRGPLEASMKTAAALAQALNRPCLQIDLAKIGAFKAARLISDWLRTSSVEVVYITGSTTEDDKRLYHDAANILETVFFLNLGTDALGGLAASPSNPLQKQTADDPWQAAVGRLLALMPLRERTHLRRLAIEQVADLRLPLVAKLCGCIVALLRQPPEWPLYTLEALPTPQHISPFEQQTALLILQRAWQQLQTQRHVLHLVK